LNERVNAPEGEKMHTAETALPPRGNDHHQTQAQALGRLATRTRLSDFTSPLAAAAADRPLPIDVPAIIDEQLADWQRQRISQRDICRFIGLRPVCHRLTRATLRTLLIDAYQRAVPGAR
jgi:hypothetical protein